MPDPAFSRYKDPAQAVHCLTHWSQQLQALHQLVYQARYVPTEWRQTLVWVHTPKRRVYQTLVFFPGSYALCVAWQLE